MAQPPWLGCPVSKPGTHDGRQLMTPATMLASRAAELGDRSVLTMLSYIYIILYFYKQDGAADRSTILTDPKKGPGRFCQVCAI